VQDAQKQTVFFAQKRQKRVTALGNAFSSVQNLFTDAIFCAIVALQIRPDMCGWTHPIKEQCLKMK